MDLDVNLDVLMAVMQPPPAHERIEDPEAEPAGGFAFRMDLEVSYPMGGTQIDALAGAPLHTPGEAPINGRFDTLMAQRMVSSDESLGGAITEAVADLDVHPISAVGRVTAVFGGRVRYCTGTVVAERLVLTAAHCAFARTNSMTGAGEFADWMLFQPQYLAGESLGNWAGEAAYVPRGWGAPQPGTNAGIYDLALVRLDAPIAHRTGTAGVLANADPLGPFTSLGYPRKSSDGFAFDGQFLYASTGERLMDPTPGVVKAENGLTEGSSGGPWFTSETGEMRVAGINSTKPVNSDEHTWSPELGEAFQRLLARALADMMGV
ncbi:MAG: S1 family peptidase [Hyphomonadaceae bacterium]|nr:S1 family peptidase [Hyphomonadaceae bacterium]